LRSANIGDKINGTLHYIAVRTGDPIASRLNKKNSNNIGYEAVCTVIRIKIMASGI